MLFSDLLWVWLCLRVLCADVLALAELQVLVALLRVAEVHVHLVPVQRSAKVIFLGCVTRPLRPEATHATCRTKIVPYVCIP